MMKGDRRKTMTDDDYFELLQEQHDHDVVMLPSQISTESEENVPADNS